MIHILFLTLIAATVSPQQEVVYDDLSAAFKLAAAPRRIVSLAPNMTEILFALGLGDRVVGVTRYCDYPAEALEKEKIGGMVDPNLEKIQSLRPDLVVAFRGNPLGVLNKLKNLRFPVFVLNLGSSIEGLFETIEKVGRVTRAEDGQDACRRPQEEARAIRVALADVSAKPRSFSPSTDRPLDLR
jgi:iron complex transport system substrate-binding protein